MSPFGPSFPLQPDPFSQSPRPLSPLSTVFTPNRPLNPLSTAFTQKRPGWTVSRHSDVQKFRPADIPPAANQFFSYGCTLFRLSCPSFCNSHPLFSIPCSLFCKITRVAGTAAAFSFTSHELPITSHLLYALDFAARTKYCIAAKRPYLSQLPSLEARP